MTRAASVARYPLVTYVWPSRTPTTLAGSSLPILYRATLTTVESRNTDADPRIAASMVQRSRFIRRPDPGIPVTRRAACVAPWTYGRHRDVQGSAGQGG